jgi:hypothetical protein
LPLPLHLLRLHLLPPLSCSFKGIVSQGQEVLEQVRTLFVQLLYEKTKANR